MKQNSRIQLENTLIGALGVLSLVLFILSFLPGLGLANRVGILLEMGHMVQRAFSVVLFILTFQLWKRKRAAWNIAVILLFFKLFTRADSTFFAFVSSVSPGRSRIISASPVFSEGLLLPV